MLFSKIDACAILAGPCARNSPEVGCFSVRLTHAQYLQDHVQEFSGSGMLFSKIDACAILAGPRAGDSPEVGCFPVRLTHAQDLQDHLQEIPPGSGMLSSKIDAFAILAGPCAGDSLQYCGSGMFIPDPRSRIRIFLIPNSNFFHSGSEFFSPKNCFQALGNMIWVVHPRSRSRIMIFYPSRIPDPGTGSWIPDPDPQR